MCFIIVITVVVVAVVVVVVFAYLFHSFDTPSTLKVHKREAIKMQSLWRNTLIQNECNAFDTVLCENCTFNNCNDRCSFSFGCYRLSLGNVYFGKQTEKKNVNTTPSMHQKPTINNNILSTCSFYSLSLYSVGVVYAYTYSLVKLTLTLM